MSRITDRYIESGRAYNDTDSRLPDLRYGGQFGYAPNLSEIIGTTPYIQRDMVVLITRYPGMFDILPDGQIWRDTLRFLIEVHPKSVEGFNATITLSTSDVQIDPSGATIRPVNDSVIEHTQLNFTYPMDFVGQPITRFYENFVRLGIWDPTLNRPLISTLGLDDIPDDWTLDMYSFDIIAFEPDVHFRSAVRAWEVFGVHPLSSGPIVGAKDPLNPKSITELQYQMTGVDEANIGTRKAAQKIIDEVDLSGANPYTVKSSLTDEAITEVTNGRSGYFKTVDDLKSNQLDEGEG